MAEPSVRSLYRRLLQACAAQPVSQRAAAREEVRIAFREFAGAPALGIKRAEAHLQLLETSAAGAQNIAVGVGRTRFIFRNGKLVEVPVDEEVDRRASTDDPRRDGRLRQLEGCYNATARLPTPRS
eukprot:TRINITY_DN11893_c0_g1_i1.p2 TRINITY_DN11893_c0_g1~~TRINITY_DN11893_c0_g1_i1.p2  ORF type:complete len:126 (-),score=18.12 TRINITY_DN11893_c0_g1_i1:40-417(-)